MYFLTFSRWSWAIISCASFSSFSVSECFLFSFLSSSAFLSKRSAHSARSILTMASSRRRVSTSREGERGGGGSAGVVSGSTGGVSSSVVADTYMYMYSTCVKEKALYTCTCTDNRH